MSGLILFGAGAAAAAPTNAKNATTGTFDCGAAGSGTFVVNSGNSQAPQTWNSAHLTFADGSTDVFHPSAFDLTFSFMGQSFTSTASHSRPGDTTCQISSSQNGFTLSG